jgi:uncharacterized protein YciI
MRIGYLYFMTDEPHRVRSVAPQHAAYWRALALPNYVGGPFADRSGGLITFEIDSVQAAQQLIDSDPFYREDLLTSHWLKEWLIE